MTITSISPVLERTSVVPFGVEHEYNLVFGGDHCGDPDCYECEGEGEVPTLSLPAGWQSHEEHCGYEIKTGVETDIVEVMAEFRRLERVWYPNEHDDCGLHVHLNANPNVGAAIDPVQFFHNYSAVAEELRELAPGNEWRLGHQYCERIAGNFESWLGQDRMNECAAAALAGHGTVEVRLASGTSDMDAVETYLRALLGVARDSLYVEEPLDVMARYAQGSRWPAPVAKNYLRVHCGYTYDQIYAAASAVTEKVA